MSFFAKARARVVEQKHIFKGWNNLYQLEIDYTRSNGSTVRIQREVVDHGSAVAVLLYDPRRDAVVLVRQFRAASFYLDRDPFILEAPAGLMDDNAPDEAVRREAMEETGYRIEKLIHLFSMFGSPGALAEEVVLFVGLVDQSSRIEDGGGLDDENEDIEVVELALADAFAMIASGEISDAKTIILLQWAMMNRDMLR
jgi:nudix-type nucleoside diphosphatase (YffH/AdpP family)